jgi:aerobic carbon-monoxide dehydrogenase large subunit
MLPGVYAIPTCFIRIAAAYTNTVPVDAYRGAGRPEAAYLIERLVDVAARELGVPADTLRRKNFIKPKAMPYTTATGRVYDSGAFADHLARAQEIVDWKGFARRATQSKKAHKLRGIGLATYIEACGNNGPDAATVVLGKDGNVTVLAGSQSTGQGHKTAYAQLVAEHLDLPPERVTVIQGDTDLVATGAGTGGSSSITCGGASVASAARKLADNLKVLAANRLEAAESDLEIEDGAVRIAGTDRAASFAELAALPAATPAVLSVTDTVGPPEPTYPNGTHIAEVEVDIDTGAVKIIRFTVMHDCGTVINPMVVEGQVVGGVAHGIGNALFERLLHDADGQPQTVNFADYLLPGSTDMPPIEILHAETPSPLNPLGMKGAGEGGTIPAIAAIIAAVENALAPFGITINEAPISPARIAELVNAARKARGT